MLNAVIARIDAALDEHPVFFLTAWSVLFLGAVVFAAATTPFDSDEVLTILTSQMPSRSVMWAALAEGVDDAPPLYAAVAGALHSVVGPGHVVTRLPAIAGAWVTAVILFVMVRRRTNALLGLAAALACAIASFRFAIEARGYAPAMACVAVALFAWTQLPEGRRRLWYAGLFAASLGAAPWWHDTAALALVPFIAGELLRWWDRSRPDWLAWGAIGVAVAAALPLLGLAGQSIAGPEPAHQGFIARMGGAYADLLAPFGSLVVVLAWLAALLFAIWTIALVVANRAVDLGDRPVKGYEIAAALGFALMPALGAAFAMLFGFQIGARDLAVAIPGLVATMMVFLATFTPRSGAADLIVTTALGLSLAGTVATSLLTSAAGLQDPVRTRPTLVRGLRDSAEPVVLAAGAGTLQLFYYAERGWPGRAVILADPALGKEISGSERADTHLIVVAKWTPARVEPFFPYSSIARAFQVHESAPNWLLPKLKQMRAGLQEVESGPGGTLWRVRMRAP
jgi:hypothetical protein